MKSKITVIKGKINWYDKSSKRGSILSEDGIFYRIHQDCKLGLPDWKIKPNTKVKFNLYLSSIHPIIEFVVEDI